MARCTRAPTWALAEGAVLGRWPWAPVVRCVHPAPAVRIPPIRIALKENSGNGQIREYEAAEPADWRNRGAERRCGAAERSGDPANRRLRPPATRDPAPGGESDESKRPARKWAR